MRELVWEQRIANALSQRVPLRLTSFGKVRATFAYNDGAMQLRDYG